MAEKNQEWTEVLSSIAFGFFAFSILGALLGYFWEFFSKIPSPIGAAIIGALATLVHFFLGSSKRGVSDLVEKERVSLYLEVLSLSMKNGESEKNKEILKILSERKEKFIIFGGEMALLLIDRRAEDEVKPLGVEDLAIAFRKDMNFKGHRTEESLVAPWVKLDNA